MSSPGLKNVTIPLALAGAASALRTVYPFACNAGTSHDFTHYFVTLPAANTATAIDMLAEMVRNSVLDETELEKERKVER